MDRSDLHGFVPAIVTPFARDGAIDEGAFKEIAAWLIGNGATGLCIAGDNGESWALSPAERGRLTALAKQVGGEGVPIISGSSAPTLDASLAYARAARDNGADALLMMPPTYVLKGTADEVLRRFDRVAADSGLPIVAYNSPRRAGHSMPLDLIGRLIEETPVIGIKESDRDFPRLGRLIHDYGARMQVMVGPSYFLLPGLALGAAGFIATGPELLGADAGRLVEVARAKPGEEYRRLHHRLSEIYQMLMNTGTWPAALKAALTILGQPAGAPRDPVLPLDEKAHGELAAAMAALGIS